MCLCTTQAAVVVIVVYGHHCFFCFYFKPKVCLLLFPEGPCALLLFFSVCALHPRSSLVCFPFTLPASSASRQDFTSCSMIVIITIMRFFVMISEWKESSECERSSTCNSHDHDELPGLFSSSIVFPGLVLLAQPPATSWYFSIYGFGRAAKVEHLPTGKTRPRTRP